MNGFENSKVFEGVFVENGGVDLAPVSQSGKI